MVVRHKNSGIAASRKNNVHRGNVKRGITVFILPTYPQLFIKYVEMLTVNKTKALLYSLNILHLPY